MKAGHDEIDIESGVLGNSIPTCMGTGQEMEATIPSLVQPHQALSQLSHRENYLSILQLEKEMGLQYTNPDSAIENPIHKPRSSN